LATYSYKARDKSGKLIEGKIGAESERAVAVKLEQMAYFPIAINEAKTETKGGGNLLAKIGFGGVKFSELNLFTRNLFVLQRAGLPLLTSLNALGQQTTNKVLQEVIQQVSRDVEAGATFSIALQKHPKVFNDLYVNMIRSGEVSGRLSEILERLANLREHEEKIRMRINAAMRYPFIVIGGIIVGFITLNLMVVPRFAQLYASFDTDLPLATQILIASNEAIQKFWWLVILILGAMMFGAMKYCETTPGRRLLDSFKLNIIIFGPLFLKLTLSRFCRITGTLMKSGVPILQILDLVADSVGNVIITQVIRSVKDSVNEGKGMLVPMKASGMFPPIVTQMVAVGEETGKLDELLLHVADYYDSQVDYTINNLVSLIEPILIFTLGIAVLFMALGIFMPMWNMMHLFQH
jgi:type II secretory pathway component PulF